MPLTLYYHPLASFCHKVLIALYENGTAFDKRLIDLGNAADRAELAAIWPFASFPVIRDAARQRDLPESSVIIEYLDHHFPGERRLVPGAWEEALEVRLWDRFFDNHVHLPMQQIVANEFAPVRASVDKQRADLLTAYRLADRRMAAASGRTWACGEHFSLADCAAVPALFYASTLVPFPAECTGLSAYFERLMERPSVRRVIDEAKPYFAMYPFAKDIPQRFR